MSPRNSVRSKRSLVIACPAQAALLKCPGKVSSEQGQQEAGNAGESKAMRPRTSWASMPRAEVTLCQNMYWVCRAVYNQSSPDWQPLVKNLPLVAKQHRNASPLQAWEGSVAGLILNLLRT